MDNNDIDEVIEYGNQGEIFSPDIIMFYVSYIVELWNTDVYTGEKAITQIKKLLESQRQKLLQQTINLL